MMQGPKSPLAPGEDSDYIVKVENIGSRSGDVVVICYVKAVQQSVVEVVAPFNICTTHRDEQ